MYINSRIEFQKEFILDSEGENGKRFCFHNDHFIRFFRFVREKFRVG